MVGNPLLKVPVCFSLSGDNTFYRVFPSSSREMSLLNYNVILTFANIK